MRARTRVAAVVAATVTSTTALVGSSIGTAFADVPTNDTLVGATAITSLPYDVTEDTTQATNDSSDAALNSQCGWTTGAETGTVWFTYTSVTADAGQLMVLDGRQSSYSPELVIAQSDGSGGLTADMCDVTSRTAFEPTPGTTYTILVEAQPYAPAGTLSLHADREAPPTISATQDAVAKLNKSGAVTVTGTYRCTGSADAGMQVYLDEPTSKGGDVNGTASTVQTAGCDGLTHPWSVTVAPQSGGKFMTGKAVTYTDVYSTPFDWDNIDASSHQSVTIKH